jgi:hypothetical protein
MTMYLATFLHIFCNSIRGGHLSTLGRHSRYTQKLRWLSSPPFTTKGEIIFEIAEANSQTLSS